MKAVLTRIHDDGVRCLGVLFVGSLRLYTVERPWKDNVQFRSCIPVGTYKIKLITRPSGKLAFEIRDVMGRTHILIHPGNDVQDVVGCIAPGLTPFSDGVHNSRKAMDELLCLDITSIEVK